MAFCSNCGASLEDMARFCAKCGTPVAQPVAQAAAAAPVAQPGAPPTKGSNVLKVLLIAVGVVLLLGVLALAGVLVVGYKIARSVRIEQEGKRTRIETPVGTVETTEGGSVAAEVQCAQAYPAARATKRAGTVRVGGLSTVTCESDDSLEKVLQFFKAKFPDATATIREKGRHTIAGTTDRGAVSVTIEPKGDGTKFTLVRLGK